MSPKEDLECVRNEEYKIWKKQSPFLYDVCVAKAMPSPSSSVEWLPSSSPYAQPSASGFQTYTMLLTSSSLVSDFNGVYHAQIELPNSDATPEQISAVKGTPIKVLSETNKIKLDKEFFCFRAQYAPFDPSLVACACRSGNLILANSESSEHLKFHTSDVLDISFSKHAKHLASVSGTGGCVFDLNDKKPMFEFNSSTSVNAVQFAPINTNEFVSGGDDRTVNFWDLRTKDKPVREITDAHGLGITAVEYSPFNENLLATGSADGMVSLWDVRFSSASLLGLNVEAGQVNALKFSVHEESVIATGGVDAQVKIWDFSKHGQPQSPAEEEEGPPELMFIHAGHMAPISDIAWHPTLPWTLCSVSEDSLVDIWRISGAIVN